MLKKYLPAAALLALAALVGGTGTASAQSGLVSPRPLMSPRPEAPKNAAGESIEGWVTVRFTVLEDGTATDVHAVDVMPPSIDPAAAIEAVGKWTFLPGKRDGEAIDWFNNEEVIVFGSPSGSGAPSEAFQQDYQAIGTMIGDEDYAGALAASRKLIDGEATQLGEIGLTLAQQAVIDIGREDLHSALIALRQASDPRVPMLSGNDLFSTLQLRMQVEQLLGRIGDALESYDRLAFAIGSENPDPGFVNLGKDFKTRWETDEYVPIQARIGDRPWRIDSLRPLFYIDKVEGKIDTLDFECDTRQISIDFQPDADFQVPASLGKCVIFAKGQPGTTFRFVEVLPQN